MNAFVAFFAPAAVALLATTAPAQFDDFTWTFSGDPAGSGTVSSTEMNLVGPAFNECSTGDTFARMTTTAPVDGTITAHVFFDNQDGGFGWWTAEDPTYIINGQLTYLGPGDIFDTWKGDATFHVDAGDVFGFGAQSIDCSFGPGLMDITEFVFTADTWANLGNGLAGTYGIPPLTGLGKLEGGDSYNIGLVDALENAPAWLVLGVAELNASFKGGILVPDPVPPAVLIPFTTSANGRIILIGTWPVGLPGGGSLFMQYWIQDPAGPVGWSASNALEAILP